MEQPSIPFILMAGHGGVCCGSLKCGKKRLGFHCFSFWSGGALWQE